MPRLTELFKLADGPADSGRASSEGVGVTGKARTVPAGYFEPPHKAPLMGDNPYVGKIDERPWRLISESQSDSNYEPDREPPEPPDPAASQPLTATPAAKPVTPMPAAPDPTAAKPLQKAGSLNTLFESAYPLSLLKQANEKPVRHRVEVIPLAGGHVLTGAFKGDGSHGFFGGGIDAGEAPESAAVRELAEESGFVGENPRLLPVEPHHESFSAGAPGKVSAKAKARAKMYSGSLTHYVAVDVADKSAKPGTDHKHSFDPKSIGFRPIEEAMPLINQGPHPERGQRRLAALLAAAEPMQKAAGQLDDAEALARRFHETYERLAPDYGYATRKDSSVSWEDVPNKNKKLMVAVADEILHAPEEKTASGLAAALLTARNQGHISGKLDFNSRPAQASPEQVLDRVMAMRNAGMPGGPKFRNLNKVSALGRLLGG